MARQFLVPINLAQNELQNARIHNSASAPGTPVTGQIYYNTGDNTLYWYNGGSWVAAKDAGATSVFYQTIRDDGTARTQRNALNFVSSAGNTINVTDDAGGDESEVTVDTVFAAVTAQTTFGAASGNGSAATSARSDHTHGTPTHDNAAHSAITLNSLAQPTAQVNMGGQLLTNLAAPSGGTDATTKTYVDNLVHGLSWKDPVRVATTANGTLASAFQNGASVDGVTLATGDRILIKDQSTGTENGIYTVNASGAPTRATDADAVGELDGAAVWVNSGTANADKAFTCTTDPPITPGSTATTWVQFGGGTTYVAGTGMVLSTNTFNVQVSGGGLTANADDIAVATGGISNTHLATMPANTVKMNNTAGVASPTDVTTANLLTALGLSVPVTVAQGGTGRNTATTAYGLIAAGTTATGVQQTISPGTSGHFLKSAGGSALAAFAQIAQSDVTNLTTDLAARTRKYTTTVGGSTSQVINHALNTQAVVVDVYKNSGVYETVDCDIERTDANNVTLRFATAPAASSLAVVVIG